MFAFFNLGLQELVILAVMFLAPMGLLLAYLLGAFGTQKKDED